MSLDFTNRVHAWKWVNDGTTGGDRGTLTTVPTLLNGIQAYNLSTGVAIYLHLYDSTARVSTAGVDSIKTLPIPAAVSPTTVSLTAGFVYAPSEPVLFSSGLTYAIGGNLLSTAAYTTVAANLACINIDYTPYKDT